MPARLGLARSFLTGPRATRRLHPHRAGARSARVMIFIWSAFVLFVLALLALDLGVFNRRAHVIAVKEALGWSAFWIALGLLFSICIYFGYERHWMGLGTRVDTVDQVYNDGHRAVV